jgi:hypothetical protein
VSQISPQEWYENFTVVLSAQYAQHLSAIKTLGAQTISPASKHPVLTTRQALIEAFAKFETGSVESAKRLVAAAELTSDSGAVSPDTAEFQFDGIEVGRGHACMWGAISRVLAHKQANSFSSPDATLADSWFGVAFLIFSQSGETTMAGRVLQEWAESRRLFGDEKGAELLFEAATCSFLLVGNHQRVSLVANRASERGPVPMESSFFLKRPATELESRVLSSVLGARNTHRFFRALK